MARTATKSRGKKKTTRGRKKTAHELPGGFWRQIVAILLALVAVFLVLTWMGDGGDLLQSVDWGLEQAFGGARYFVPLLLVWMAMKIFRSEGNRLAPVVWIASCLMIFWLSGAFGLSSAGTTEMAGGVVGDWLNKFITELLNPSVAVIIYIILIFVTAAFILQLTPDMMIEKVGDLFRTKEVEQAPVKKKTTKVTAEKTEKKVKHVGDEVAEEPKKEEELKPAPKLGVLGKLMGKKEKKTGAEAESADEAVEKKAEVEANKALVAMSDPNWKMPEVKILEKEAVRASAGDKQGNMEMIRGTLAEFGIDVEMEGANVGPRVTQYTMRPPAGVNLSKILSHDKELALNLAVDKIRIEAPIPGTRLVGVELPNQTVADVRLRSVLESKEWKTTADPLTFAVGKDLSGHAVVANLAKMPHLLIAGTTGSGKSVMTNTLISSLLYRNAPSDLKLIIVDPKQVEMAQYERIPHLLTPIITSTEKALSALRWAVNEMEKRYTLMAEERVKNIVDYNTKMAKKAAELKEAEVTAKPEAAETVEKKGVRKIAVTEGDEKPEEKSEASVDVGGEKMPYIVILIDEMADLMMMAGKDMEVPIVRIAQKGRAAGIHLVLATQRPEVKVITGLIKANVPGRIAFAVQNQVDARVMDVPGADKLLGKGDMLMLTTEMMGKPRRIQGAWASDQDVNALTDFLRAQRPPEYNNDVVSQPVQIKGMGAPEIGGVEGLSRRFDPSDPLVRRAIEITLKNGKFSTASLQTWLGKGHGYVSSLAIWLEEIGVIGPVNGHKPRDVLISTMEEFEEKAGGAE